MTPVFSDSWKVWIWHNVGRGCGKDGIAKVLLEQGFSLEDICVELGYEPANPDALMAAAATESSESIDSAETPPGVMPPAMPIAFSNARRFPDDRIELYEIEGFVDVKECEEIVRSIVGGQLQRSGITNDDEPDPYFRTSKTCYFDGGSGPAIDLEKTHLNFHGHQRDLLGTHSGCLLRAGGSIQGAQ